MNSHNKPPPKELVDNFLAMRVSVLRAGELALEMMAHPDATPEHLAAAHKHYANIKGVYMPVRDQLRGIWPRNHGALRDYPWNETRKDRL